MLLLPAKKLCVLLLLFSSVLRINAQSQSKTYNIVKYGAKNDALTNNDTAIQKAIDAASAAGGGKVIVPAGQFVTSPISLKNNVELNLEQGAALLGSINRMDYGKVAGALISAKNQNNIALTGKGTIDGRGTEVVKDLFKLLQKGVLKDESWKTKRPSEVNRPRIVAFSDCTNIRVQGITLKNSAGWVQDYVRCTKLDIDGIKVESTAYWNNDGIDIVNSKDVRVTNCYIDVADDALCLKLEGGEEGICENIYVENCTLRSSASGFKLGTGSYGGFKNITVKNLHVFDTYRSAIALEAVDGGFIENVNIQNVTAENVGNAIFIRLGHRNNPTKFSTVKGVFIAHVKATIPAGKPDLGYPIEGPAPKVAPHNLVPSSITGIPGHPVQDVTLEDIEITYGGGANKQTAFISTDALPTVTENEAGYPEFSMFGELPSWAFYIRHAENIRLKNVRFKYLEEDFRPAIIADDVQGLALSDIKIETQKELPAVVLNKVSKASTEKISVPGEQSKAVKTQN